MSAALCLGYSALAGYARPGSAYSREAGEVSDAACRVMRDRLGSESLFGKKMVGLSTLVATVGSVVADDEQEPVSALARGNAEQFLLALPEDLQMPEVGVDPDGAVSLTWFASRTRMFSASIDESERVAFAWLDGSDKGHAVARFRPPVLPEVLIAMLRSTTTDAGSALRAA